MPMPKDDPRQNKIPMMMYDDRPPSYNAEREDYGYGTCQPLSRPPTTAWSAQQIATIASKLERQLGPEFLSFRAGPSGGPRVSYIEGHRVVAIANEVFGFNGWSSSIRNFTIDFMDTNRETGKCSVGVSCTMRVTLKDGAYHEDIGYGTFENARSKGQALEKARKEASTDALKRTLRNFGNVLGNCLYDKDYVRQINGVKAPQKSFNADGLYRRDSSNIETQTPIKREIIAQKSIDEPTSDQFGDFDEAIFDSVELCEMEARVDLPIGKETGTHEISINAKKEHTTPNGPNVKTEKDLENMPPPNLRGTPVAPPNRRWRSPSIGPLNNHSPSNVNGPPHQLGKRKGFDGPHEIPSKRESSKLIPSQLFGESTEIAIDTSKVRFKSARIINDTDIGKDVIE